MPDPLLERRFEMLPDMMDFIKQVERGASFEGSVPLRKMPRLVSSLVDDKGEASAEVGFAIRAGVPCLSGKVSAEVEMTCQRCLEPVTVAVEGSFRFGLVESEQAIEELPAEFEAFIVNEGEQSLYDVLEDELILSLPIVGRHEHECSEVMREQEAEQEQKEGDTYRPFAGLKDLMQQD